MPLNRYEREHLWNVYLELGTMERHFGDAQLRCWTLASTWFLAMFAGIGFLISENIERFNPDVLIAAIGFIVASALFVMWVIDLIIYQRLLDAAFIEGMSLEKAQPWLPQIRQNRRDLLKGTGLARFSYYYAVAFWVAGIIGCIGVTRALLKQCYYGIYIFIVGTILILILAYLGFRMLRETKSTKKYEDRVKLKRTRAYKKYDQYHQMAFLQDNAEK